MVVRGRNSTHFLIKAEKEIFGTWNAQIFKISFLFIYLFLAVLGCRSYVQAESRVSSSLWSSGFVTVVTSLVVEHEL